MDASQRPRRLRRDVIRRRNLILQRLAEGFSEAEVARALDVSRKTVRRAIAWLRAHSEDS